MVFLLEMSPHHSIELFFQAIKMGETTVKKRRPLKDTTEISPMV